MIDLVVVGGGPAGLSAALNGAAEGLVVTLLERTSELGGQAGTSSRIENYLGWPNGVPGVVLTAKAVKQATRLGARVTTNNEALSVKFNEATETWATMSNRLYISKAVVLATGVDYRHLPKEADPRGLAIYGAPAASHSECAHRPVIVVGGGNSAGQAALSLAKTGANVNLLARRAIRHSMSHYLVERIAAHDNIKATLGAVVELSDEAVRWQSPDGKDHSTPAFRVFVYIGMTPRTGFVHNCCTLKPPLTGYIETDDTFTANPSGLFVAGDVRQGSFKRVAAAVGEGAIAAASAWRHIYDVRR